ncbi:efflux RND transporter periplasmic adaptor subunit [Pelagicoccus sp. SDUM812003]|uniref:efflux RND transporter periplasmic adaptor subunit n=1 Tax=Pelagicoccus sp. SDUM812003 TaxID=3041267 RepID=UPI00280DE9E5|nr:efflux RND transporter periplasmic adaptor subunit [Pelagicoccus sp. SDUM812003]MDQ8201876.1 efflux RND transporter periplasmic adaptor subunit [Pelagicoccus sp. SDUM812003]
MKRLLQITLPIGILLFSGAIIYFIMASKEEPQRQRFQAPNPEVVVRPLQAQDYTVTLHSQGTVKARTESSLIPEVRGRIVSIAPNFQEGAFFEEGEVLLKIDDRDYLTELTVAEAQLAQAELTFMQETARYDQARRDWDRLNPGMEATELTLREPQLRQANAAVASAKARVETAKLNLERTEVRAPYAGRVLTKSVDVGQFVSTGNELARIYAVDYAEVRLPLTASQMGFLDLPSIYRGSNPSIENGPLVTLKSSVGGNVYSWEGRVIRSEGAVDTRTRQLFVVAQIQDPYGKSVPGRPPLKVGTFVEAEIEGTVLEDVVVIPRKLYRENSYVLVVNEKSNLDRRDVETIWEDKESIIVKSGLRPGELLCLTDVPYALEGWEVTANMENANTPASAYAHTRPSGGATAAGGTYADSVMSALGEKLPADLRDRLVQAKSSNDWSKMGPLMRQISEWASANGETMPPRDGRAQPQS